MPGTLLVVYADDKDIAAAKTPAKLAADFEALVTVIQRELPSTKIAYLSIKPIIPHWSLRDKMSQADALIEAHARRFSACCTWSGPANAGRPRQPAAGTIGQGRPAPESQGR